MRIAIAGGTGVVGHHVVARVAELGHTPVVISRSLGVDLTDRQALSAALCDVDAVVDVSNPPTIRRSKATSFFSVATANLAHARSDHGIDRSVVLSIIEVDKVPGYGYFEAKVAHERAAMSGPRPSAVVRASQFYEFAGQLLDRVGVGPICVLPTMVIQPIAARTVAEVLVDTVLDDAPPALREIAGPEIHHLVDLARDEARRRGRPRVVVGVAVPTSVGRHLRSGSLCASATTQICGPTYATWRQTRAPL